MTDLRQAAQAVVERWDSPKWEWSQQGPTADLMASLRTALEQQAEPVSHAVIVGALFDFMGWLTTRKERLILSSTDNASPAADAIKVFAEMRGLSLDDARVQGWQTYTTPSHQQAEPVAWDKPGASFAGLTLTEVRVPFGMTIRFEGGALIVETIHNVKEGKTPAFISCDAHGNIISKERNNG